MRVNRQIRVPKVRVINSAGEQVGVISIEEALHLAEQEGLDLVEIVPNSNPPVCKVIDYGKFRYDQTKREKESKKAQHQVRVKEVKLKPNIDIHDLETKTRHARDFLSKGNKVKVTCMFRGRERLHPEYGERVMAKLQEDVSDISVVESPVSLLGRIMIMVLAPGKTTKKKVEKPTPSAAPSASANVTPASTSEAPEQP